MEWSDSYLYTYVDDPFFRVVTIQFREGTAMWQEGGFPSASSNGSLLIDPWSMNGRPNTPFDQEFYLILDFAFAALMDILKTGLESSDSLFCHAICLYSSLQP